MRPLHDSELRSKFFWLKTCSNSRVTSAWPASDMSPPLSNYFAEFILSRVAEHRARLIGNRWTLVGAILYLLEWVAIAGFNPGNTPTSFLKPDAVVTMYASHAGGVAAAASWFSVVLLGRILFTVGIRDSLKRSGADTLLADFAVGAMAVSVILEIASYALAGAAAALAHAGGDRAAIVAVDAAGGWVNAMIFAPLGLSVLAAAYAQLRSGLFPAWLAWLGGASGGITVVLGLVIGPALAAGPGPFQTVQILSFATLGFWVWMLATGIILFRRTT